MTDIDKELAAEAIRVCKELDLDGIRDVIAKLPNVDTVLPDPKGHSWNNTTIFEELLKLLRGEEHAAKSVSEAIKIALDAKASPNGPTWNRPNSYNTWKLPLAMCGKAPEVAELLIEYKADLGRKALDVIINSQSMSPEVIDMVLEASEKQGGDIPRNLLMRANQKESKIAQLRLTSLRDSFKSKVSAACVGSFYMPSGGDSKLEIVLVKGGITSWFCDGIVCCGPLIEKSGSNPPQIAIHVEPGSVAEHLLEIAPSLREGLRNQSPWDRTFSTAACGEVPANMIFWINWHANAQWRSWHQRSDEHSDMPAPGTIHGTQGVEEELHNLLRRALNLAENAHCATIAMPTLGLDMAICKAAQTFFNALLMYRRRKTQSSRGSALKQIAIVSESDSVLETYRTVLRRLTASQERKEYFECEQIKTLAHTCPQPFRQPTFQTLESVKLDKRAAAPECQRGMDLDLCQRTNGFTIKSLLTPEESANLINASGNLFESVDWEYEPTYRTCRRAVFLSKDVAHELWQRVRHLIHRDDIHEAHPMGWAAEGVWSPVGINECLRISKYDVGGHFAMHRDGPFVINDELRSVFTVLVYLNEGFEGGATTFEREHDGEGTFEFQPKVGDAVVFTHTARHEGSPVTSGVKYVLRTDIMFRRIDRTSLSPQLNYIDNPKYQECESLYRKSIELQNEGDQQGSTESYLKALEFQAELAGKRKYVENANGNLSDPVWIAIFTCFTDAEIVAVASLCFRFKRVALDSQAWLQRYHVRWGVPAWGVNPHVAWYSLYKFRRAADENWRAACFDVGFRRTAFTLLGLRPTGGTRPRGDDFSGYRKQQEPGEIGSIPSVIARILGHYWGADSGFKNYFVGNEVFSNRSSRQADSRNKRLPFENRNPVLDVFTEIIRWVFAFGFEMFCEPAEHPLVVVLPAHVAGAQKSAFADELSQCCRKVQMEHLHHHWDSPALAVPYLLLENHAALALTSTGYCTGLSIHLAEVCSATLVKSGACLEPVTFPTPPGLGRDEEHLNLAWGSKASESDLADFPPRVDRKAPTGPESVEECKGACEHLAALATQAAQDAFAKAPDVLAMVNAHQVALVLTCDGDWPLDMIEFVRDAVMKALPLLKNVNIDHRNAVVCAAALVAGSPEGRSRFRGAEGCPPLDVSPEPCRW